MLKACVLTLIVLIGVVQGSRVMGMNDQTDPAVRGRQLIKVGKLKQAEDLLRSASQANPSSPDLRALLGEVLTKQQKYEDAVLELGLAAQAKPESLNYAVLLAEALIGWQHYGVAVDYLNAIKSRFDAHGEFHYEMGLALYSQNKLKEAKEEFEQALKLKPELAQASFLYATCIASE